MSNKLELVRWLMMLWTNCFPPFSALCNYNQSSLFCRFCVQPLLYSCSTFSLCPSFWCWPRESPSQSRLSWSSGQTPRSRSCFPWRGVSIIRNIYRFIYLTLFILLQWITRIYAGLEICIIFFLTGDLCSQQVEPLLDGGEFLKSHGPQKQVFFTKNQPIS